jgi:glucose-1-phosphatase
LTATSNKNIKPTETNIKFVYFDLGNVLLSFDTAKACNNLATLLSRTPKQIHEALYESGLEDEFEHGRVSPDVVVAELCRRLDVDSNRICAADVLDGMSDMFTEIDAMIGVIQTVRDRGYRVGLLSNTCHAHWDWVVRQNYAVLKTPFEQLVVSYEIGSMKPSPAIYEAAESMAKLAPKQLMFIDDKPENVSAARHRGWNAETCVGGPQAISILKDYGLM